MMAWTGSEVPRTRLACSFSTTGPNDLLGGLGFGGFGGETVRLQRIHCATWNYGMEPGSRHCTQQRRLWPRRAISRPGLTYILVALRRRWPGNASYAQIFFCGSLRNFPADPPFTRRIETGPVRAALGKMGATIVSRYDFRLLS